MKLIVNDVAGLRAALKTAKTDADIKSIYNRFVTSDESNRDQIAKLFGGANQAGYETPLDTASVKSFPGDAVAPLVIPDTELKGLFEAVQHRQPYQTKTFASIQDDITPQLATTIVAPVFETRLLSILPTKPISSPAYQYIKHTGTTGVPSLVAEGGAKPELSPAFDHVTVTAVKIAAWTSAGYESLQDFAGFGGYLQQDLLRRIIAVENSELLTQTGTTGHINGLINQAGLSHARPATLTGGVSTETSLDALEIAIAAMRAGSELCSPDVFVINPQTWSTIRRLKDAQHRYLFANADATADEVNQIWGIPVFVTTDMTAGTGLFINNTFGNVLVREGLSVHTDAFSASTNNIVKLIGEERLQLAVEKPNALIKVTNLATEATDA